MLDLAADGVDNWEIWRSQVGDVRDVGVLMYELSQGREDFGALPRQQQIGLFKVYAKITAVKKILGEMGRAGLNMIAAYDVYWNTEYELFTFNQSENILKSLADAISLFFTDAEWAALARGGRDLADRGVSGLVLEAGAPVPRVADREPARRDRRDRARSRRLRGDVRSPARRRMSHR